MGLNNSKLNPAHADFGDVSSISGELLASQEVQDYQKLFDEESKLHEKVAKTPPKLAQVTRNALRIKKRTEDSSCVSFIATLIPGDILESQLLAIAPKKFLQKPDDVKKSEMADAVNAAKQRCANHVLDRLCIQWAGGPDINSRASVRLVNPPEITISASANSATTTGKQDSTSLTSSKPIDEDTRLKEWDNLLGMLQSGKFTTRLLAETLVLAIPEINWLAGKDVAVTPEYISMSNYDSQSPSEMIWNTKYIEFDKAVSGISCLGWVLGGIYERFTECQNDKVKLSTASWDWLCKYTRNTIEKLATSLQKSSDISDKEKAQREVLGALTVFIVLNDIGKTSHVATLVKEATGIEGLDHDSVLGKALLNQGAKFRSFASVHHSLQEFISEGLQLGFNPAQFIQGESLSADLVGLSKVKSDSILLYVLQSLYDIAGAAGHVMANGSLVFVQDLCNDYSYMLQLLDEHLDKLESSEFPNTMYMKYLCKRGEQLGLNPQNSEEDFSLCRLACMLRFHTQEQATLLKTAANKCNCFKSLTKELNFIGNGLETNIMVYYGPALLLNCVGKAPTEGLICAGLEILSSVFDFTRTNLAKVKITNNAVVINVSDVAKWATETKKKEELEGITSDKVQFELEIFETGEGKLAIKS